MQGKSVVTASSLPWDFGMAKCLPHFHPKKEISAKAPLRWRRVEQVRYHSPFLLDGDQVSPGHVFSHQGKEPASPKTGVRREYKVIAGFKGNRVRRRKRNTCYRDER